MPWGMCYGLQTADKTPAWQLHVQYNLSSSLVVDLHGTVYFVAGLLLYAVQPSDGALPDKNSSWPQFRANARHTGRVGD